MLERKKKATFCRDLMEKVPELKKEIEDKNVITMTKEGLRNMMDPQNRNKQIESIFWDNTDLFMG
jgi:hypothetical protein